MAIPYVTHIRYVLRLTSFINHHQFYKSPHKSTCRAQELALRIVGMQILPRIPSILIKFSSKPHQRLRYMLNHAQLFPLGLDDFIREIHSFIIKRGFHIVRTFYPFFFQEIINVGFRYAFGHCFLFRIILPRREGGFGGEGLIDCSSHAYVSLVISKTTLFNGSLCNLWSTFHSASSMPIASATPSCVALSWAIALSLSLLFLFGG